LVTIKGCGHFAFLERPADVRRALDGFLLDASTDKQRRSGAQSQPPAGETSGKRQAY